MVKSGGIIFVHDLLGIARADSAHLIRTYYRTFRKVYIPVIFHDTAIPTVKLENIAEYVKAVNALIFDIVYGIKGGYSAVLFNMCVFSFKVNDRKRALPIVSVKNVGIKVFYSHKLKYGF